MCGMTIPSSSRQAPAMDIKVGPHQNLKTIHCRILISQGINSRKDLMKMSGASRTTVSRLLKAAKQPTAKPNGKTGPKPLLQSSPRKKLRLMAYKWPQLSNAQLALKLEEKGGPKVSRWTLGRSLKSMAIVRKKPRHVPLLTEDHRRRRLAWCLRHRDTDWSRTVFSDESRFQYYANNVRLLCPKKRTPLAPRPGYSPGVMVWGGISMRGATPLALIDGTVDSLKYQEILKGYLIPTMDTLYPEGYVLQQDNARPHTSRSTRKFFEDQGLELLDEWPANSPDLNPIENLWGWMKRMLEPVKRTSVEDWKSKLEELWDSVSSELIEKLVVSMPQRIEACIAANGGHTKY